MNLQYYHNMDLKKHGEERFTICLELPNREDLVQLMQPESNREIVLKLGKAVCSEKDQYVRATGRELSKSRLSEKKLYLFHVDYLDGIVTLQLGDKNPDECSNDLFWDNKISLSLQIGCISDRVKFIRYNDSDLYKKYNENHHKKSYNQLRK